MLSEADLEVRQLREAQANQLPLSASVRLQLQLSQGTRVLEPAAASMMPNEYEMKEGVELDQGRTTDRIDPDEQKVMMEMEDD